METSNLIDRLIVASAIGHQWQSIPKRGVVRLCEPIKFWWYQPRSNFACM